MLFRSFDFDDSLDIRRTRAHPWLLGRGLFLRFICVFIHYASLHGGGKRTPQQRAIRTAPYLNIRIAVTVVIHSLLGDSQILGRGNAVDFPLNRLDYALKELRVIGF